MVNASLDERALAESMGLDANDLRRRKQLLGFGEQDAALLEGLQAGQAHAESAFAAGYQAGLDAALHAVLPDEAMRARLQQAQQSYLKALAQGDYGLDYAFARMRLGIVQQAAGLPPQWQLGEFGAQLDALLPRVIASCDGDQARLAATLAALLKRTLLDFQISLEAYYQNEHELLRLLSQAFECNVEAVFIADIRGHILHANPTLRELSGYAPEELAGESWQRLFVDPDADVTTEIWLTVSGGGRWQGEALLARKDGEEFSAWINVSSVKNDQGAVTHFILEFSDITPFKRTQEELAQRTEELAHSNRELEQFAYVASHDLQEPLRMVASYTQLLARRYKDKLDADANEFIHYAVDGATRMQALIIDLLTLSRVGTHGKPIALCDAGAALDRALGNLRMAIEESGATVTRDPMPTLTADISQLTQLFQNLVGNAIKFHGELPPQVHIGAERHEDGWQFSVRDNGIGIAPEFHERIFVIFQRLHGKHEYPGTGIGLSVCKKIVERHGGHIWVDATPGGGTTFHFTLPQLAARKHHGD